MNKPSSSHRRRNAAQSVHKHWWAGPAACLATLLALPATANISIPNEPLTSQARVAPNLLFLLDNSGSMLDDYMPDNIASVGTINIARQTYARNLIYYDPNKTYEPWVDSSGAVMTGGTAYTAAYSHGDLVPPFSTATVNLSLNTQTFYVPKNPANVASHGDVVNYWRYQILTNGSIERSEWDGTRAAAIVPAGYPLSGLSGAGTTMQVYTAIDLPANAVNLVIQANGVAQANLFLRQGGPPPPSTANVSNTNASKTITRTNPAAGLWYVGLQGRAAAGFSGASLTVSYQLNTDGCTGGGWINCTPATPTGRSVAAEQANFATWYSYHRTRMKVAKAGAGRAFSEIGTNFRVGYRNIWNNMPISGSSGGVNWSTHPITRAKPIPVQRNNGLFDDPNGPSGLFNNRTAWYQRLYAQTSRGATPLRKALWDAGDYFATDHSTTGPWGPDQYACRHSFTILTTDGYRNDDSSNSASFDYTGVGGQVGEQDNVAGSPIYPPSGAPYTYVPTRPYAGAQSDTLADIAMYYWKNDLRPDLPNLVLSSPSNPAFWQHMSTFAISIGAAGTLNPQTDLPAITAGTLNWPTSLNLQPSSIDDLWHASVNGRGSFVLANDPEQFSSALRAALREIEQRASSFSNVATNSVSLDSGAQVFNASYIPGVWTGQVTARAVTSAGVSSTLTWTSTLPAWGSRKIFTTNGLTGANFPTAAQSLFLVRTGGPVNYPVTAAQNANYIKGDDSLEEARPGGTLRNRPSKLGDIVGSSPAYVRETNTLYVGANDGMLHAFDASTGVELFAYVPNIINFPALSTLSRPDYAHRFFVDGPVVVSNRNMTPNKNILVGTLGRGGKGLFALDVTNPTTATAASVYKWERAETPGNNMGLVLGRPFFSKVQGGTTAVVMGNGVNSTGNKAVLIVLNAETGAVIREIDTGIGSALTPNGLSAPTGVLGPDGRALAYVYAGDLLGNVWKFDLTDASPSNWGVTKLFEAKDSLGNPQPISGGVTVASHPIYNQRWVFFGTGRYLTVEDADASSTSPQSMYGIIDTNAAVARSDLTLRTLVNSGETVEGYPVRTFETSAPLPVGSKGWYIDLPESGERIVQDAQVVSTFLITASMIPTGAGCDASGTGYLNAVDAFTGTSAGGSYFDLDGNPVTPDLTSGGLPVGSINVGIGMPTLPNLLRGLLVVGGTAGSDLRSPATLSPRWDRASWREIRRD